MIPIVDATYACAATGSGSGTCACSGAGSRLGSTRDKITATGDIFLPLVSPA